jgi:hypothetical protein
MPLLDGFVFFGTACSSGGKSTIPAVADPCASSDEDDLATRIEGMLGWPWGACGFPRLVGREAESGDTGERTIPGGSGHEYLNIEPISGLGSNWALLLPASPSVYAVPDSTHVTVEAVNELSSVEGDNGGCAPLALDFTFDLLKSSVSSHPERKSTGSSGELETIATEILFLRERRKASQSSLLMSAVHEKSTHCIGIRLD